MANHLTPSELADVTGMKRRDVITKCMQMGVPIFQGRIDKTLFIASLKEEGDFETDDLATVEVAEAS